MTLQVFWSDKIKAERVKNVFQDFVSRQAKRLIQGHARYGEPDRRKKYMTRAILELKEYKKTGNVEHLYNVSNYCILESIEPENKKFHFNAFVDSVTRGKI